MSILQGILDTYAQFFDLDMWIRVLQDPVSWGLIGTLVVLEGLLSADNALVLAVMVKHLPEEKRKKALFYGLIGAYVFRFIAIGIGMFLIKLAWVKVLGALYLAWLSIKYFIDKRKGNAEEEESHEMKQDSIIFRIFGVFWGTVVMVELMDIAFSVDSVLAAFGVSNEVWILLLGGMLGILMMRGIAGVFLKLLERIPELETTAYILILIIATKMLLSVFDIHISHTVFFIILVVAFAGTFVLHYMRNSGQAREEVAATKKEDK
ncbi:TerC family protein [Bacillus sp. DX1.1]|uniref:TerC family protein n=1 Tax=unclassified Bacillus (in: firmicutes) TaxID=185979 RepID=UPI0025701196|nr:MULTISPECIES: TerC family protein [unclassified Bacillus (in: firmicutes)]MDM5153256.1 TerC family protein [Bacillus sp. DX1.1]WJE82217.1 TerC family protein [Bacillus sp. DX3.1]